MFSRILSAVAFSIFIFNAQIIFPHNLSKSTLMNPDVHHSLFLETKSYFYNEGINNFDFNTRPNERIIIDTANTD
jgi:hypothetical protein